MSKQDYYALIKTCSDKSKHNRKPTLPELLKFCQTFNIHLDDKFSCGWCRFGRNEWMVQELIWDEENEFLLTPCCHTEATEALDLPDEDEENVRAQDESSYRYAVTGRL